MKKTASILILMTLVLSGCTQVSGDLNGRVKKSIADALALQPVRQTAIRHSIHTILNLLWDATAATTQAIFLLMKVQSS